MFISDGGLDGSVTCSQCFSLEEKNRGKIGFYFDSILVDINSSLLSNSYILNVAQMEKELKDIGYDRETYLLKKANSK